MPGSEAGHGEEGEGLTPAPASPRRKPGSSFGRLKRDASFRWHDGIGGRCGVGLNHLAFRVESRAAVDALRAWCRKKKIPML